MQIERKDEKYEVVDGYDWFWKIFSDGSWEPGTFKVFDKFLDKKKTFVDIGAWIGPMSMYASSRAKKVFAFEPDPTAFINFIQNLDLNKIDNVVPYPVAVSHSWDGIPFGAKEKFGDSMSSQIWGKPDQKVPAIPFIAVVADLTPNFIKIDIEGGEKFIFSDPENRTFLENFQPTIHLSLHTPWFKDDLDSYKKAVTEGIGMYPYFYDQELKPIKLADVFDVDAFNSVVATYKKL